MTLHKRRDFLKKVLNLFFLTITAFLIAPVTGFFKSKRFKERTLEFFFVAHEENLPRRGVKGYEVKYSGGSFKIFIVNMNGEFVALSSVCTHLGCSVNWNMKKGEFICPCHGGRYSIYGNVIAGPPPEGLYRLPLRLIDGNLYVGLKV